MFSQNVAKITPPSHFYFRSQLPIQQAIHQWKAVYYFSGLSNRVRRTLALREKASLVEATHYFESKKENLLTNEDRMQGSVLLAPAALASPTFKLSEVVQHIESLNEYGFTDLSYPYIQLLHSKGLLTNANDIAAIIRSYRCEGVRRHLLHTTAKYDPAESLKQLAEHRGAERAGDARRVLEMAHERLTPSQLTACYNAYMEALMTCGYDGMRAIAHQVYDQMGQLSIPPTLTTYEHVILALGLTGDMAEAEQVANYVISSGFPSATSHLASSSDPVTAQKLLPIYHALLIGYRENKIFDKCDMIWKELVEHRSPRPNAITADLYLRSIIDLSYLRTSNTYAKFGEMNIVEKKRIPLILAQMDELSIPRTHLSQPVHHEVEDALRKFSIYKNRFYNWGRAVKQFNFIEFRRRNGWLYGMNEMVPTVAGKKAPRRLPWSTDSDGPVAASGQFEVPQGIFEEVRPWLESPLEHVLNKVTPKERYDDTRAADYFYNDVTSIHDRSPSWSTEVPQTRYDQLYGLSKPDLHRVGIRRHLAAEWADGVLGGEERSARDEAVLKSITSTARRSRKRAETHATYRSGVDDTKSVSH